MSDSIHDPLENFLNDLAKEWQVPRSMLTGHVKRDPLICPGRSEHEFMGWREFDGGLGGETVCEHCGVGAMEHTMALEDANPDMWEQNDK